MNTENTKAAIAIIRDARAQVADLLRETPEFQIRATNVFDTLANGLAFAVGEHPQLPGSAAPAEVSQKQGRTVMGMPVPEPTAPLAERLAEVIAGPTEMDDLRARITGIYETFPERSNKEILNTLTDLELRGVARMAGLAVTKTDPQRITTEMVTKIKAAITAKLNVEAQAAAALATPGIKEGSKK